MRHLFNSRVEIFEATFTLEHGSPSRAWAKVNKTFDPFAGQPGEMMCWLDLNFLRTNKDAPPANQTGSTPDRTGLMLCSYTPELKAGHVIKTIAGPVTGTFEIKMMPDVAITRRPTPHHIEVQIFEVNQAQISYPASEPL